jgi:hypothetical protein
MVYILFSFTPDINKRYFPTSTGLLYSTIGKEYNTILQLLSKIKTTAPCYRKIISLEQSPPSLYSLSHFLKIHTASIVTQKLPNFFRLVTLKKTRP